MSFSFHPWHVCHMIVRAFRPIGKIIDNHFPNGSDFERRAQKMHGPMLFLLFLQGHASYQAAWNDAWGSLLFRIDNNSFKECSHADNGGFLLGTFCRLVAGQHAGFRFIPIRHHRTEQSRPPFALGLPICLQQIELDIERTIAVRITGTLLMHPLIHDALAATGRPYTGKKLPDC